MMPIGLFVIQGVQTCGLGQGYCLLSNSCRVDSDFENDNENGHCDGLKHAFTPYANFVCCQHQPPPTTTPDPAEEETTEPVVEEMLEPSTASTASVTTSSTVS